MNRLLKRKNIFIVLVLLLVISSIWYFASRQYAPNDQKSFTVKRGSLVKTLILTGRIDADEKATVRFQTGGMLSWVGVKPGDTVSKGQALASLDQRSVRKNIEIYLNNYMKTRLDFENTKRDYSKDADTGVTETVRDTARRMIQKAQFDLNNSVLNVELQDLTRQYATLTSPIHGVVTSASPLQAGVNVSLTTDGYTIINPDSIYLSLLPDQSEVVKLTNGMTAQVIMDSFPDIKVTGTIVSIGFEPKPGESSTVYETKLDLSETSFYNRLRLGMTGDATFTLEEKSEILVIPQSYIVTENGKTFVIKKVGSQKEKVEISLGMESDTEVEVLAGLSEGDVIYD